eukprot:232424-Hanusia_phi.AAC.1
MLLCRLPLSPPGGATLSGQQEDTGEKECLGGDVTVTVQPEGVTGTTPASDAVLRRGVRRESGRSTAAGAGASPLSRPGIVALDAFCFHCHGFSGPGRSSRRRKPDL